MRISDWSSDVCSSDLPLRAGGGDQDLLRLDAQHPALVHLATALVGAPHSRMVRPGRRGLRRLRRCRGGGAGRDALRQGRAAGARPRRARHLVLVGTVVVLDAPLGPGDLKSVVVGKGGSVRVDLGGRRTIKTNKDKKT